MIVLVILLLVCIVYAREIVHALGIALLLVLYAVVTSLQYAAQHWVWTLAIVVSVFATAAVAVRLEDGRW